MLKNTQLAAAIAATFAVVGVSYAQQQQTPQKVERVEVTGSAIKRVNEEGATPVEVYTRKDIEKSGATTVAELIKNIAAIEIDDQGEQNGNSPSGSGASNIQIRGLSERNTLILLNGRRLPVNALHDGSGAGAAVDVNAIPISAIERIEILKDGGSAIYGADAVAGVINFITRKSYTGLEVTAGFGISERGDGQETPIRLTAGFGDFDKQRFNVLASFDYFKRDGILRKDREITRTSDYRRYGGSDGRSTFAPQGNRANAVGSLIGGSVRECGPALQNPATVCRYDFNASILEAINGADRYSGLMVASFKVSDSIKAFGEFVQSGSKDEFLAHPAPGFFPDPTGVAPLVRGRFLQGGPRTTNRKSTLSHLVAGLEGSTANYDWDIAIGQGTSKVTNKDRNYLNQDLFFAAIESGALDPTSTTNPQSLIDSISVRPSRTGKSVSQFLNGKFSGQITNLAGGPLAFAVGGGIGREKLDDTPDPLSQQGLVFGSIAQAAVSARRETAAIFAELSIPFVKNLETQIAVRFDDYKDKESVGGRTNSYDRFSPKVAAKYKFGNALLVRGSYAESFLAPSLKQMFGAQEQGAESTSNPVICNAFGVPVAQCSNFPYLEVSGSNPNLKPEIGKTLNFGIVIEPTAMISLGLDWFQIKKSDEINTLSSESAAARGNVGFSSSGEALVFVNNLNLAETVVQGVDADMRLRFGETSFGKLSARVSATYYDRIDLRVDSGDDFSGFAGTWAQPRWRTTVSFNLERGPWDMTVTGRTTSGFYDSPTAPVAAGTRKVDKYDEVDLAVAYSGMKNLRINGGVKNVFDRMPPFSNTSTQNQYGSQGYAWIYSPRGRFYYANATYSFR
jgi:iron complex outermembrane recepter protein